MVTKKWNTISSLLATHKIQASRTICFSLTLSSTLVLLSFAPATYYSPSLNFSTALWNASSMENCTNFSLPLVETWLSRRRHLPCSPLRLLLHLSFGIRIAYKLLSATLTQPVSSRMFSFHCSILTPGCFPFSFSLLPTPPHFMSCHCYYSPYEYALLLCTSTPKFSMPTWRKELSPKTLNPPVVDSEQGGSALTILKVN